MGKTERLEDTDFADDIGLLMHSQQDIQEKWTISATRQKPQPGQWAPGEGLLKKKLRWLERPGLNLAILPKTVLAGDNMLVSYAPVGLSE